MPAQPRCPIICEDADTGEVVHCARWEGHPDTHASKQEVVEDLYYALCLVRGIDGELLLLELRGISLMHEARQWYKRLVVDG